MNYTVNIEQTIFTDSGFQVVRKLGIDKSTKEEALEVFDRYANRYDSTLDEHFIIGKEYILMSIDKNLEHGFKGTIRKTWYLERR